MKINILTIFPDFFKTPLETSILKRALAKELLEIKIVNLRDFASDRHQTTDLRPYGGGPGMVMMVEPIDKALQALGLSKGQKGKKIILTSAKGQLFTQEIAKEQARLEELTIICGHYEGVDERVALHLIDEELRIGDYVLTGGETASLVMLDAVTRLIPNVLGNELSNQDESHSQPGKFAHPQYTKPANYKGWEVPEVLLSGDHAKIEAWRKKTS
jgi:tRNA (guanine37-N1)-methyltransferase